MTITDPSNQLSPIDDPKGAIENQPTAASVPTPEEQPAESSTQSNQSALQRRILIGSQRDPVAYRARQKRDWTPVDEGGERKAEGNKRKRSERGERKNEEPRIANEGASVQRSTFSDPPSDQMAAELPRQVDAPAPIQPVLPSASTAVPGLLAAASDLDAEMSRAIDDASIDELLGGSQGDEAIFEPASLQSGRVVAVRRDDVFVEFGGRQQGIVSLRQFDVPPQPGATVQVVVQRLNPEDGLYELTLPNKAVQVDDWSDLIEGALVEIHVTGHNAGGLECEVNHIRGFIPFSQVSLYRVEDLAPYVDQRLVCVITEADPERRNLVLSRRAVLEREKEQAREQMLNSLHPGQIHDGVVRKLMDFGAFVDIGGVDGLLHVSQLAWGRVKHPSDVLHEGQAIKVRVEKVDATTGKISLAYRDLLESPWTAVAQKYPRQTVVHGAVTTLMEFGAFVELEPGIEGLIHISELSHKRVSRPAEVVKEGQEVDVVVLSVDPEAQRISLSLRAAAAPPEPEKSDESAAAAAKSSKKAKPTGPLIGGLGRKTGDRFGLKW